jgi:hypothetical protein
MAEGGWNRREFAGAAAFVALAIGVPSAGAVLSDLDDKDAPSDRQRKLMREVGDLVLPATDTPGAGEAGVGDFVLLALAHGLDGSRAPAASGDAAFALSQYRRPDGSLRHADWLEHTLDRAANGDWLRLDRAGRERVLTTLDAEAFAQGADLHPWRKIKGLIVIGYYTSEVGGSQELRYELVPGRWDPKVLVGPDERAFSSDWTAVDFG